MNVSNTNLLNSLVLIIMGFWGFLELSSPTALIPAVFGVILLICFLISKAKPSLNKLFAHIAVTFTILILIALVIVRLPKSIDDGGIGLVRVISMISTSTLALVIFIKSFIDVRIRKL